MDGGLLTQGPALMSVHVMVSGHALFLNDGHLSLLRERPIPVELCPSSNMKTLELASHSQHPTLERFLQDRYPFSM